MKVNRLIRFSAGKSIIISGILVLPLHFLSDGSRTFNGYNYADVWHLQLSLVGWALIITGGIYLTG